MAEYTVPTEPEDGWYNPTGDYGTNILSKSYDLVMCRRCAAVVPNDEALKKFHQDSLHASIDLIYKWAHLQEDKNG